MTIHIDYDREENKIESILASQSNVIRTLGLQAFLCKVKEWWKKQPFLKEMEKKEKRKMAQLTSI